MNPERKTMTTLTLKKKIVLPAPATNIGQFAIMRKSSPSKGMRFSTFHDSYKLAAIERDRLKSITDDDTFYIVCVVCEA